MHVLLKIKRMKLNNFIQVNVWYNTKFNLNLVIYHLLNTKRLLILKTNHTNGLILIILNMEVKNNKMLFKRITRVIAFFDNITSNNITSNLRKRNIHIKLL